MQQPTPKGGRIAARIGSAQVEETGQQPPKHDPSQKNRGLGRLLVTVYGIFALAAFARSVWQLFGTQRGGEFAGQKIFDIAPVSISLSVVAAVVYIVATIALAVRKPASWYVAMVAVIIEFVGVVAVSILSYAAPELFDRASVWSHFGSGYGYVPIVLPCVGLWWLLAHRPRKAQEVTA
ncbi:MAG: hypothetical protein ACTII7_02720 [Galactobacter sp.]